MVAKSKPAMKDRARDDNMQRANTLPLVSNPPELKAPDNSKQAPSTSENLVLEMLHDIEKRLEKDEKLTMIGAIVTPLVVALIALGAGIIQTKMNNTMQAELIAKQTELNMQLQDKLIDRQTEVAPYAETLKGLGLEKLKFYNDVKSTLSQIDMGFEELTHFEYEKKHEKLAQSLSGINSLIRGAPLKTSQELLEVLTEYSEYISSKWQQFDENPADDFRKQAYRDSKTLLQKAKETLEQSSIPAATAPL